MNLNNLINNVREESKDNGVCIICNNTGRTANNSKFCEACGKRYIPDINNVNKVENLDKYNEDWKKLEELKDNNSSIISNSLSKLMEIFEMSRTANIPEGVNIIFTDNNRINNIANILKIIINNFKLFKFTTSDIISLFECNAENPRLMNMILNVDFIVITVDKFNLENHLDKLEFILDQRQIKNKYTILLTKISKVYFNVLLSKNDITIYNRKDLSLLPNKKG